ncbi:jg14286 [Pararge aegeria aegeria]|uniref:Jg14286 protein n=1 Tax=Pararge aegeria aegeria TaxID=348720 RepID=A0A8S4RPN1_9NEOP|nr:jg14286 [Pararge aegeria aegeria]
MGNGISQWLGLELPLRGRPSSKPGSTFLSYVSFKQLNITCFRGEGKHHEEIMPLGELRTHCQKYGYDIEKLKVTGKVQGKRFLVRSSMRWSDQIRCSHAATIYDTLEVAGEKEMAYYHEKESHGLGWSRPSYMSTTEGGF